jgi:outer membrane protein OmpA-like peptidoglycan-associated protein
VPRKMLTGFLAAGIVLLIATVFVPRFDLASLWLSNAPPSPDTKRITDDAKVATATPPVLSKSDQTAAPESSKFDVVRIDPDGASVFAGRAPANAQVTVLANGQAVAAAKADENGQWATVIERPFASGDYQLSLRTKPSGGGAETAGQSVSITIAANARPTTTDAKAVAVVGQASAPAPITFVYDEANFTPAGRKEAALLTEFLRRRQLDSITLTGHADERGSDEFNMELSRRRLDTVARFLREAGYTGKLVLVPKGRREPFPIADRDRLPKEDAFQLDRRVELHLKQ